MSVRFIYGLENYTRQSDRASVVTVGTFDGIHLGHQEILRRLQIASDNGTYDPIMVSFHPHPRTLVTPDNVPMLLTTIEEREQFVPDFFNGTVLVLRFDEQLKSMSARKFVQNILLETLSMKKLVVGYDHAFGRDRSGTIIELKKLGEQFKFDVEVVGPVMLDEIRVSSTLIRKTLTSGSFAEALRYLGHPYAIYGKVERGIGLGRKLGYPTANVAYNPRKLLPPEGVYVCRAIVEDVRREGMMFIGRNHFNPENRITVEANFFDFDQDIYGQDIIVCPTHFIRYNRKFENKKDLIAQITLDKKEVTRILQQEMKNVC